MNITCILLLAVPQTVIGQPPPYPIPDEISRVSSMCGVRWSKDDCPTGIRGSARIIPAKRRLSFDWTLHWHANHQEVSLDFRPTYMTSNECNDAIVAGIDRWGGTHIRRYTVSNIVQGEDDLVDGDVEVESLFYSTPFDSQTHVYRMWNNPLNPQEVFVHFWNTRDVQILDTVTGDRRVVAKPTGTGAFLTIPELQLDYDFVWPRQHTVRGQLYFFYGIEAGKVLVLQDANFDSTVEAYFVLQDRQAWTDQGLDDASQYVN